MPTLSENIIDYLLHTYPYPYPCTLILYRLPRKLTTLFNKVCLISTSLEPLMSSAFDGMLYTVIHISARIIFYRIPLLVSTSSSRRLRFIWIYEFEGYEMHNH